MGSLEIDLHKQLERGSPPKGFANVLEGHATAHGPEIELSY